MLLRLRGVTAFLGAVRGLGGSLDQLSFMAVLCPGCFAQPRVAAYGVHPWDPQEPWPVDPGPEPFFHQCFSNYQGGGQWPGDEHSAASLPVIMGAIWACAVSKIWGHRSWGWKLGAGVCTQHSRLPLQFSCLDS